MELGVNELTRMHVRNHPRLRWTPGDSILRGAIDWREPAHHTDNHNRPLMAFDDFGHAPLPLLSPPLVTPACLL
jgi:hypothetical protein